MTCISPSKREAARAAYFEGDSVADISKRLELNPQTVHSWKRRDKWGEYSDVDIVEETINKRLVKLINRDCKSDQDFMEIDKLIKGKERVARIRKYESSGKEGDLNPKYKDRARKGKKGQEKGRNQLSDDDIDKLREAFHGSLYRHQEIWYEAGLRHTVRNILKSRQIGATWFFAREALIDAIDTGRNQIFLSASKAQAHVFKAYIIDFVLEVTGKKLTGDPIVIGNNGATLYFLSTNKSSAQSYHGNLYTDEYFWIPSFKRFQEVTSGMSMQKEFRLTYFSTPSTISHEAYPFWTGKAFNEGRPKTQHINLDVSHESLKNGRLCADGQWRQIVTALDAHELGYDRFDLDALRLRYNERQWNNLLMCQFVDDKSSIFTMSKLKACMVDSWDVWEDFQPFAACPLPNRPVWIGYDPSRLIDAAAVVVVAPPQLPGGKYRVIETHQWQGMSFTEQAERIREICEKYTVTHLEIDCTGPGGLGAYDLVSEFFEMAEQVFYSPSVKNRMVAKTIHIIDSGMLEYDSDAKEITMSLMNVHMSKTKVGGQTTYSSGRDEDTGHADIAWALFHALNASEITSGDIADDDGYFEEI